MGYVSYRKQNPYCHRNLQGFWLPLSWVCQVQSELLEPQWAPDELGATMLQHGQRHTARRNMPPAKLQLPSVWKKL